MRRLLQKGNTKLGNIYNWSIPAIHSCPGRSELCESICYAASGFYNMKNVQESHKLNWKLSKSDSFVDLMINEIKSRNVELLRIHVAGDFYSYEYIDKWSEIIETCDSTKFFTYTRSWNVPLLRTGIERISYIPNMQIWLSCDHTMPEPPCWSKTKIAYLAKSDNDCPIYNVDLVFREDDKTVVKKWRPNNALVCPVEQGTKYKLKMTCERCKYCFKNKDKQ